MIQNILEIFLFVDTNKQLSVLIVTKLFCPTEAYKGHVKKNEVVIMTYEIFLKQQLLSHSFDLLSRNYHLHKS